MAGILSYELPFDNKITVASILRNDNNNKVFLFQSRQKLGNIGKLVQEGNFSAGLLIEKKCEFKDFILAKARRFYSSNGDPFNRS